MSELQNLLYASNRYAVLLIFQAMDAAGKDSAIISQAILDTLAELKMAYPKLDEDHGKELRSLRKLLAK
jgi:polyphosphate kinase 2 (PPK2 family)